MALVGSLGSVNFSEKYNRRRTHRRDSRPAMLRPEEEEDPGKLAVSSGARAQWARRQSSPASGWDHFLRRGRYPLFA